MSFEGIVCACMDARRNQVYNALFSSDGEKITRLCPDRAISLEDLLQELTRYDGTIMLVGDGAALTYNTLKDRFPALRIAPEHLRHQRASGVALCAWEMAQRGEAADGGTLTPNYLRLSQAERERMERENKK